MRLHKIKKKVSKYWGPRWIQNREESLAHKRLPCTIATTELCYKYHNQLLDADNQSKNSPSMSATSPFMSSASSCSLSFWKVASSSQRSRCRSTMQFLSTQYWTKLWKKKITSKMRRLLSMEGEGRADSDIFCLINHVGYIRVKYSTKISNTTLKQQQQSIHKAPISLHKTFTLSKLKYKLLQ